MTSYLPSFPPGAENVTHVVVVDADTLRAHELEKVLTAEGYEVSVLREHDALAQTLAVQPDAVLIAADLAADAGIELCKQLRQNDPTRRLSLMLVGDAKSEDLVVNALEAGADDFIASPVRARELVARLRVQMRNKRFREAVQRLRSERDVFRRDAQFDPLTRLPNRRTLEMEFQNRFERNEPFGVLFIDLDEFKQVNDIFGHDMGDRVLCRIADVLWRQISPNDSVGRFGGEEFVVVVGGAGLEETRLVAERIRSTAEGLGVTPETPVCVTLSVGAAAFDPLRPEPIRTLLNRADKALYEAKRTGRNKVVVEEQSDSPESEEPASSEESHWIF
ncbi:MAG TPA: diguanylate cyclase [Polyangiaceae bacterium]|nr:diguanylate cyclase [Polyangiaceae bacterium]